MGKMDASVKSTLPPQFWSIGVVFAAFFGLLTVASKWTPKKKLKNIIFLPTLYDFWQKVCYYC
jgi:hypothetical protein